MSGQLQVGSPVTLDGTGAGSVTIGPGRQGERWNVARYTTNGASATEPSLQVFRGSDMIDTTPRGNGDVSEMSADLILWAGESLRFAYTAGTPGAIMSVYVEGVVDYGASG